MGETRSDERSLRTSRTAPRRRTGAATSRSTSRRGTTDEAAAQPSRAAESRTRAGTATLEREPEPTPTTDAAPADTGRRTSGRGRAARTEQRSRTPRHRLLLACTGVLALGMLAVLLLNTIISQGAFRQHELEIDLILLAEKEESLARQVQLAETPIEVEKKARELGMVPAAAPVFLRLSDGKILGEPVPAEPETTPVDFADAPGILPTPDPSASASDGATGDGADATTGVVPALDPATGLDAGAAGTTGATAASPSAQPSAEPSAGAATNGSTVDQDQATSNQSAQATEGGNQ